MTIGDTRYNFDSAHTEFTSAGLNIAHQLNNPDAANGGVRSEVVDYTLANFDPRGDVRVHRRDRPERRELAGGLLPDPA
jgi:hypothetical protein